MVLQKKLKTLREVRKEKGLVLADIYVATRIWMAKLSGIERGHFVATDGEKKRIAKVLKVAVNSIDWGK